MRARVLGRALTFVLGAPGRAHGRERARRAAGGGRARRGSRAPAPRRSRGFSPQKGRGARFSLPTPDGAATIIDESYNANPGLDARGAALLGAAKPGPNGRRIAVIGDMLELGADGAAMHAELAADLSANRSISCSAPGR